jgi:hypothetical protein
MEVTTSGGGILPDYYGSGSSEADGRLSVDADEQKEKLVEASSALLVIGFFVPWKD